MEIPKISYLFRRFDEFLRPISQVEKISLIRLYMDCFFSFFLYGSTVKDYSLYKFYRLNRRGRKEFLTGNRLDTLIEKNNAPDVAQILQDKEKSLIHFSDFIHRDWCGYQYHNTTECYQSFAETHTVGIVKPLCGLGGHGIEIVKMADFPRGGVELRTYCQEHKVIIEELICQHEDMSRIHSSSVNTVRMVTVNGALIGCILRTGVGGSDVDNASSGGIYALADCESGVVMTEAMNYKGERYARHPDTDVQFIGFSIPLWDKCKALVSEAAPLTKGVPIVGWDIAVTPQGPTIVEVNESPDLFILQSPSSTGIRKTVEKYLAKGIL